MNFKFLINGILGIVFFYSTAFAKENVGDAEWKLRMHAMLSDVLTLFPYAFDETKFNDPTNAKVIEKSMKSLAKNSEGLKKHTSRLKVSEGVKIDPSFPFIAEAFENEISTAQTLFQQGKGSFPQARVDLRSALSKCMLCHTQSANGPELNLAQFKDKFAALSSSDRFMALAATRQFDEALSEFSAIIQDSKVKKYDKFTNDEQAKTALAIAVRVKKDPKRTLLLIDEIAESKLGTNSLKSDLKGWKKSALSWQAEKAMPLDSYQILFSEANRLMETVLPREFEATGNENLNVVMLRASSYLHDLLLNYPQSPLRAKSYILLATTYKKLPGFALWDLSDEYLVACIHENPHSEIGEQCFDIYQENTIIGYSGSSGTHIPWAVRQYLDRMKKLSSKTSTKKTKTPNK